MYIVGISRVAQTSSVDFDLIIFSWLFLLASISEIVPTGLDVISLYQLLASWDHVAANFQEVVWNLIVSEELQPPT